MKTSELTGAALDWAVAKAIGEYRPVPVPNYSTDWAQGGPIIERELLGIDFCKVGWVANADAPNNAIGLGTTPLIAAMRCYVASKLGDEVEIPKELTR